MALGHWAKSYLSEGKANNGGGGSGGGSGVLLVPLEGDGVDLTATKTAAEILAADSVVFTLDNEGGHARFPMLNGYEIVGSGFTFTIEFMSGKIQLTCTNASDYPAYIDK